jgi:uncharacterized protein YyaL (SSP411 family)
LIERSTVADTAKKFNVSEAEATDAIKKGKDKLWNYRIEKRPKPHRDDKVVYMSLSQAFLISLSVIC